MLHVQCTVCALWYIVSPFKLPNTVYFNMQKRVILRDQQIYTAIQAVYSLLYIVAQCIILLYSDIQCSPVWCSPVSAGQTGICGNHNKKSCHCKHRRLLYLQVTVWAGSVGWTPKVVVRQKKKPWVGGPHEMALLAVLSPRPLCLTHVV